MNERSKQCVLHTAKIEQLLDDMKEIKDEIKSLKSEAKSDRQELWDSFNSLRESITGNSKEGLTVRVDRNTQFRNNLSKLLWALFTPLYGGMIIILVKLISDYFG